MKNTKPSKGQEHKMKNEQQLNTELAMLRGFVAGLISVIDDQGGPDHIVEELRRRAPEFGVEVNPEKTNQEVFVTVGHEGGLTFVSVFDTAERAQYWAKDRMFRTDDVKIERHRINEGREEDVEIE